MCIAPQQRQEIQDNLTEQVRNQNPGAPPEFIQRLINAMVQAVIERARDHRHEGYDVLHDWTPECCGCCKITKKSIVLQMLLKLKRKYPADITNDVYDDLSVDIEFYYDENPEGRFIPQRMKTLMIRLLSETRDPSLIMMALLM